MADSLVVGSKVRARVKQNGCNMGGDLLGGLNDVVASYVDKACGRAKANGRKTAGKRDV